MKIKVKGQVLKMITAGEWIDKVHEITDELERNADLMEANEMKKEIINCLTWYANRVAETVQYETWSDEYARKELKKSTHTFLEELSLIHI